MLSLCGSHDCAQLDFSRSLPYHSNFSVAFLATLRTLDYTCDKCHDTGLLLMS